MRPGPSKALRWATALSLCLAFSATVAMDSVTTWTWASIPLHTAIETAGALAALTLAALLSFLHTDTSPFYRISTAMGLTAMGLLDLFHAATLPGNTFVWLHGLATICGGILFLGVYLGRLKPHAGRRFLFPALAGVVATASAFLITLFPQILPNAFSDRTFSSNVLILNACGGILFLAAARRFYLINRMTASPEAQLFTALSFMFGVAGLAFPFSHLWNATWWLWHLLRLTAFALSLIYMAALFLKLLNKMKNSEALLRNVLDNMESGIVTVDARGTISSCNPAIEKMFGYNPDDLKGRSIALLMSHSRDWTTGQRSDGSLFPMNIDLSQTTLENNELFILEISDVTEQRMKEQWLSHQAHHDTLTQLPNRLLFTDRLSQSIAQAHRHEQLFAVMFLDLDNFKQINDRLGHHVGDHLLTTVAKRLSHCIREGDTVARLGGDEFVLIILDITNAADCDTVAQKILTDISQSIELEGQQLHISGSVGISLYPLHGNDIDTLVKHADMAMYQAKLRGRNNYCLYNKPAPRVASVCAS